MELVLSVGEEVVLPHIQAIWLRWLRWRFPKMREVCFVPTSLFIKGKE